MTVTWNELPETVQATVQHHFGPVNGSEPVTGGQSSDIALVLRDVEGGRAFVKGVKGRSPRMRWLRNEITAGGLAPGIAPRVLFHEDVDDWLIVAFEYVAGRAASLAPGSPDLAVVASTVEKLSHLPAASVRSLADRWGTTDWWSKVAEAEPDRVHGRDVAELDARAAELPELVIGEQLVHTDLHGDQFILGEDDQVRVIDWGFPGAGPAWVDTAFVMLRLVEAGHSIDEAEAWAYERTSFSGITDRALTAFAVYIAGLWTHWAVSAPEPGADDRARLACQYASWRLTK